MQNPIHRLVTEIKARPHLIRFCLVGAFNSVIDIGLFMFLMNMNVAMYIANFVSTTIALCSSFALNRQYTFRVKGGSIIWHAITFMGATGISLWVIQPLVIHFATPIMPSVLSFIDTKELFAKVLAIATGMVWNYLMYSRFVFRDKGTRIK
jgi:putative flippase GtrA